MVDCERQLLASWISGYNQEHIKEFTYFSFFPEIFDTLSKMQPKDINIISVSKKSKKPVSEVAQIVADYMPSMYDGAYKHLMEEKIKAMLAETAKNPTNIAKKLEAISKEMDKLQSTKIKNPTDLCMSYKQEIEKRKKSQPLMYGFPTLDYSTGGLRNQEFTVIAARPRVGKTAFALQVAFNLALRENKILFFPLEMSGSQLMERIICRETNIKHERLKTPEKMDEKDNQMLETFLEIFNPKMKPYLNIIERVPNLSTIKAHIEHYKPSVVFIDQLSQLKENMKFGSLREQFTYMTNTLKAITMELDIPIVLLAQISRSGENKEPTFSDLKESGSIEEDADNVIMLHRSDEPIDEYTPTSIIIRKQRNGASDKVIPAVYLNKRFIFREAGGNEKQ